MRSCYGRGRPLRAAIAVCCLSAFLFFGYDQGVFGGILHNDDFLNQFNHPDDTETGLIVSSYCLGALVGCVLTFFLGDTLGRRRMIWLAMVFVIAGAVLQTSAYNIPHMIVGRIITGVGTGIDTSTVPMYQSELSEKEHRGRLVAQEVLFIGIGVVLSYWIDFGFSFLPGSLAWRAPIAIQLLFAVVVTGAVWGLPESPRWLAQRGREQEAIEVLCAVFGRDRDDPYIISQIGGIREAIELERSSHADRISSLFKKDRLKTRRRVILAWVILFMNQLSGINMMIYYMPTMLIENVGQSSRTAQITSGCIEIAVVIGCCLPAFGLDQMGRRKTMLYGCTGLGVTFMVISILLSFGRQPTSVATIAFFIIWIMIFGATVNVVPWVYGPEVLPLQARARGTAISVSSHWTWNFFIVLICPILINRLGWKTYLIFMCTNLCFVPIIYFFYPETGNISLEDIDKLFIEPNDEDGENGDVSQKDP